MIVPRGMIWYNTSTRTGRYSTVHASRPGFRSLVYCAVFEYCTRVLQCSIMLSVIVAGKLVDNEQGCWNEVSQRKLQNARAEVRTVE